MHRSWALAVAPLGLLALGLAPSSPDPDDQAAADAAVAEFNRRLSDDGWSSTGPPEQVDPEDVGASALGDCLGGLDVALENTGVPIEGESARAYSDEFEAPAEGPSSTEPSADDTTAAAIVITVREGDEGQLDDFITRVGADDTEGCLQETIAPEDDSDQDVQFELSVQTEADLGVGDSSSRIELRSSATVDGDEGFSYGVTIVAARVDRSLVAVLLGASGDAVDLDPVTELEAMVEALG